MVELEKEQLEEFWKEQKVVSDHRALFSQEECLVLQSKILNHYFGVILKIKEDMITHTYVKEEKTDKKSRRKELSIKVVKKTEEQPPENDSNDEDNDPNDDFESENETEDIDFGPSSVKIKDISVYDVESDEEEMKPDVTEQDEDKEDEVNDEEEEMKQDVNEQDEDEEDEDEDDDEKKLTINESEDDEKPDIAELNTKSYKPEVINQDEMKPEDLVKLEIKDEPVPRFTCQFCQGQEASYKALKKHVEEVHLGLKFDCNLCIYNSTDREASREHMEWIHKNKNLDQLKFECGICNFRGEIQEHSDHIILVHPEYSDFLFDDIDEEVNVVEEKYAPIHGDMKVEKDEGDRWPCTICGFRAANKHSLRVHVEMNHINLRFMCIVCDFNTKELCMVRDHVFKIHEDDKENPKFLHVWCGLCRFKGLRPDYLDHVKDDHPEFFVYYERMTGGYQVGASPDGPKKGICSYCNNNILCNLKLHIQTVHMKVNYTCSDKSCDFRGKQKKQAMEHVEMKHLPKEFRNDEGKIKGWSEGGAWIRNYLNFTCNVCDLRIDRHYKLLEHMTKEHKDNIVINREYPCKKCLMVFQSKNERKEHMHFHMDVKVEKVRTENTSCKNCDHVGSSESNLKVHIMMRHMSARFTCNTCGKQFKFPSDCRTHNKKFHNQDGQTGMDSICNKCAIPYPNYGDFMKHAEGVHKMPKFGGTRGRGRPYITDGNLPPSLTITPSIAQGPPPPGSLLFCRFCEFSSKEQDATKVHMDLMHTRVMHSCKECNVNFKNKFDVVKHMRMSHEAHFGILFLAGNILYHCAACTKVSTKDAFQEHLKNHTIQESELGKEQVEEAADYSCTKCPQFQDDKSPTISHIIGQHMEEHDESSGVTMQQFVSSLLVMNCLFCPFKGSLVDFYSHTVKCIERMQPLLHAKPHRAFSISANENTCVFCGLECNTPRSLDSHVLIDHMKAAQSCGICKIKLKTKAAMKEHMEELHSQEKISKTVSMQCGLCSFKSAHGVFAGHMNTAHIEEMEMEAREMAKCNQCPFTALSSMKVSHHMKSAHEQFKCEHCDEKFISRKKQDQHYMHNHQDWTHDCDECGFSTKHKTALQRHQETVHAKLRKYPCGFTNCDRDFTRREYLVLHSKKDHKVEEDVMVC